MQELSYPSSISTERRRAKVFLTKVFRGNSQVSFFQQSQMYSPHRAQSCNFYLIVEYWSASLLLLQTYFIFPLCDALHVFAESLQVWVSPHTRRTEWNYMNNGYFGLLDEPNDWGKMWFR